MDLFSLEDDDYNDIFITQTPSATHVGNSSNGAEGKGESEDEDNDGKIVQPIYSDISDFEDFDIPSSQIPAKKPRYVPNNM